MRMVSRSLILPLIVSALPVLSGCPDRDVSAVDPNQSKEQQKEIPVSLNRDIDILFLVDNSGSMRQEQESLANNFPRFIDVLESIEGGLPNVHIGVISSNVGTGPVGGGGEACGGNGDNGNLIVRDGCPALTDGAKFISDVVVDEETGTREFNYSGDLAAQFSCMAQLGTTGCGFEQHLESMKRALDPSNSNNAGFLRDDAYLAFITVQDEDDCSTTTAGREMFDPSQDSRDAPLGELSSFRCFEFGTTCDQTAERATGPRTGCQPGDDDTAYMTGVEPYVERLKALKPDPGRVIVAAISAPAEPVSVSLDPDRNQLRVDPACVVCPDGSATGCPLDPGADGAALVAAAPAIRLRSFLDQFPQRGTWQSLCAYNPAIGDVDLSGALVQIASSLGKLPSSFCLQGDLALPLECSVFEITNPDTSAETQTFIPPCDDAAPTCYRIEEDGSCVTPSNLTLDIVREGPRPTDPTEISVRCLLDI